MSRRTRIVVFRADLLAGSFDMWGLTRADSRLVPGEPRG